MTAPARTALAQHRLDDRLHKLAEAVALSLEPEWSEFLDFTAYRERLGVSDADWQAAKADDAFLAQVDTAREALNSGTGSTILKRVMTLLAPTAVRRIGAIVGDPDIHPKIALDAAKMILEESGMGRQAQPMQAPGGQFILTINLTGADGSDESIVVNCDGGGGSSRTERSAPAMLEGEVIDVEPESADAYVDRMLAAEGDAAPIDDTKTFFGSADDLSYEGEPDA